MKRFLSLGLAALFATLCVSHGNVVRPAPDVVLETGKSLKSLRGQPVVILVAPHPQSRSFRKQVKRLERDYPRFAARGTVFVAAFTENAAGLRSNIPFVVAQNGGAVAAHYGVNTPFALLVVGKDGNLDLQTSKVSGTWQVRDAILNNYAEQAGRRR
ncbi:MAG TPA: hypothetical protein VNQ90_17935 [Chthoniobacteraceae bacterium]|nr:hypothetical protein [Chthoniobacteraceae bacterium]